jgi:hypothetical protein
MAVNNVTKVRHDATERWIGRSAGDAENLAADGCVELTSSKGLLDPPQEED